MKIEDIKRGTQFIMPEKIKNKDNSKEVKVYETLGLPLYTIFHIHEIDNKKIYFTNNINHSTNTTRLDSFLIKEYIKIN